MHGSLAKLFGSLLFLGGLAAGASVLAGAGFVGTEQDPTPTVAVGAALFVVALAGAWLYWRGRDRELRTA
jgi:membrane protein DedA with SNARE-associated domain